MPHKDPIRRREYHRVYMRRWLANPTNRAIHYARRNRTKARHYAEISRYVRKYLAEHPCTDCGVADPRVLDFDHVRGKKLGNVSELRRGGRPLDVVVREIEKCQVVCANCHRIRTYTRRTRRS